MTIIGTFESILFIKRKSKVKKKFSQMVPLMTLALVISSGFGLESEKSSLCKAEEYSFCTSPCSYVRNKCNGEKECSMEVCSYLYPICYPQLNCPRFLHTCWDVFSECTDAYTTNEDKNAVKRSILNKNVAYLLLKLHPFLNQTSQFGFLTSGRIRRITGNFGTEFLGKRSNIKSTSTRRPPTDQNKQKPKPKFYSLPLDKFSQTKVIKRSDNYFYPQRISTRGSGRVIIGTEFLGKRGPTDGKMRRLVGNEFLGKRNLNLFDGSEFLGKRAGNFPYGGTEFLGKRNIDLLSGSELLGKKSNREYYLNQKRYGNEFLGKRYLGNEFLGKRDRGGEEVQADGIWTEDDPELIDEAFYNFRSFQNQKTDENASTDCGKIYCQQQKNKESSSIEGEHQQINNTD